MNNDSTHLGHPLIIPARKKASAYTLLLNKFKSKLTGYKANKLPDAAKFVLIKYVFFFSSGVLHV